MEIVIATYKRPESIERLVRELKRCDPGPRRILVVDSSDEVNESLAREEMVGYVRARHKNQPYQRYVGLLAARAPVVVFLDDDLYVEDFGFLGRVWEAFGDAATAGIGVNFHVQRAGPPIFGGPRNRLAAGLLAARGVTRRRLPVGILDPCGDTGGLAGEDGFVQFFLGGAMAFRREVALRLFDPVLFALFEAKLGMGEDKAISMRANRYGQLRWIGRPCLRHPATQGSHYAQDPVGFLTKVLVSRLYLAAVYCETFRQPRALAYWYFLLELMATLGSGLLREATEPHVSRRAVVRAIRVVHSTRLRPERLAPGVDFWADAAADAAGEWTGKG